MNLPENVVLLSAEQRAELKRLAEAATPGPWRSAWNDDVDPNDLNERVIVSQAEQLEGFDKTVVGLFWYDGPHAACTEPNAAYIAAVPPELTLGTLAYLEVLEADNAAQATALAAAEAELQGYREAAARKLAHEQERAQAIEAQEKAAREEARKQPFTGCWWNSACPCNPTDPNECPCHLPQEAPAAPVAQQPTPQRNEWWQQKASASPFMALVANVRVGVNRMVDFRMVPRHASDAHIAAVSKRTMTMRKFLERFEPAAPVAGSSAAQPAEDGREIIGYYEITGLPVYEDDDYVTDVEGCYLTRAEANALLDE